MWTALRRLRIGDGAIEDVIQGVRLQLLVEYASEFRVAFDQALASLVPRARTLLRQHHLDGLGMDELAPLYRAHRSTLARWPAQRALTCASGPRRDCARGPAPRLFAELRRDMSPAEVAKLFRAPTS